jgi:hypothetical protein
MLRRDKKEKNISRKVKRMANVRKKAREKGKEKKCERNTSNTGMRSTIISSGQNAREKKCNIRTRVRASISRTRH